MFGVKVALHISLNTPAPLSNMVVATLCSEGAFLQQGQGRWLELTDGAKYRETWRKICWSLQKTEDWGKGSLSRKTTTLNIND